MPSPKELVSKVKRAVRQPPKAPTITHPFDVYRNPDAEVVSDSVSVRTFGPMELDRAAAHMTEAQREGVRAEAALVTQRDARRRRAKEGA